jgi:hypothetical protein
MILRVIEVDVCGPQMLRLAFNDGTKRTVDVRPLLAGPIFQPLHDPGYFARAALDRVCGTVVWPNGADFAPEALHDLNSVAETALGGQPGRCISQDTDTQRPIRNEP